ncbi:MAG: hypothetical protein EOO65_02800, partial [Methanosarcinales archaeon]
MRPVYTRPTSSVSVSPVSPTYRPPNGDNYRGGAVGYHPAGSYRPAPMPVPARRYEPINRPAPMAAPRAYPHMG